MRYASAMWTHAQRVVGAILARRPTLPGSGDAPHWGAILFTLGAGVLVYTVIVAPLMTGPLASRAPGPTADVTATPGPTPPTSPTPAVTAPAAKTLAAVVVSKSPPVSISSGATTTVAVVFRNTGTATWIRGTPAEVRLGIVGDDPRLADLGMAVDWLLPTRPAVQDETVVVPGAIGEFSFQVKGAKPGRYQVQLAPVVDGVAWLDARATVDITVR